MTRSYRGSVTAILGGLAFSYLIVAGGTFSGTSQGTTSSGALGSLVGEFGQAPVLVGVWALALFAAWIMWPSRRSLEPDGAFDRSVLPRQDEQIDGSLDRLRRLERFKAPEHERAEEQLSGAPAVLHPGGAPSVPTEETASPAIELARQRPIVFRECYPPNDDGRLSFYGGLPVAPSHLAWPGSGSPEERALHFVMQWDCSELSAGDATGLLPTEGVLYLFADLAWGGEDAFRFVYAEGPTADWGPLEPPADLGPVYGDQGAWLIGHCSPAVATEQQAVPRLLPRWPFQPLALELPAPGADDEEASGRFWNESEPVKERLLEVQNSLGGPLAVFEPRKRASFARPFRAFPHDWAAARHVAAEAIGRLKSPDLTDRSLVPDASDEERAATLATWLEEAKELYAYAAAQDPSAAVPQETADDIWNWIETLSGVLRLGFARVVEDSVNTSLGIGSAAARAIPEELIAANSLKHVLAHAFERDEYPPWSRPEEMAAFREREATGELARVRDIHARCPNRMFGPPRYVHGDAEERIDDWLLLLELSSNESIGHHFGEGVIQFLIRPADLQARRFDKVEAIVTAY